MALWGEPNEPSIQHHVYIFMQYVDILLHGLRYCIRRYHTEGSFDGCKLWKIDYKNAPGKIFFANLNFHDVLLSNEIFLAEETYDHSPMFPAKASLHTVAN